MQTDLFSFILNAAGKYRQTCNKLDFCRFQISATTLSLVDREKGEGTKHELLRRYVVRNSGYAFSRCTLKSET